ncbi:unnamed protein product [Coccothraustes coccothraustes]
MGGKGVVFPECLYTPQSDGIAPGTSYLLSRLGKAIPAACSKKPEPIGMCWMCSEQATQPGPWVSSCMETCPSYEFQRWVRGRTGTELPNKEWLCVCERRNIPYLEMLTT